VNQSDLKLLAEFAEKKLISVKIPQGKSVYDLLGNKIESWNPSKNIADAEDLLKALEKKGYYYKLHYLPDKKEFYFEIYKFDNFIFINYLLYKNKLVAICQTVLEVIKNEK